MSPVGTLAICRTCGHQIRLTKYGYGHVEARRWERHYPAPVKAVERLVEA